MNRKRIVISGLVPIGAGLLFWQFRHSPEWRQFSWAAVWQATEQARGWYMVGSVALIYLTHLIRTWRWQILMAPTGRFWPVLKGTVIGFTGIALLGRPGELVRPYYIGRKHPGGLAPQLAVWVLERVFDMAGVVLLVGLTLSFDPHLKALTSGGGYDAAFRRAGLWVSAGVAVLVALLWYFHWRAPAILARLRRRNAARPHAARLRLERFLQNLAEGTSGLRRGRTLVVGALFTLGLWLTVSGAVWMVVRAYPAMLPRFGFAEGVLLMGLTAVGAVIQLPAVGGGFQVLTIFGLTKIFGAQSAPATSAALIVWLVCFYAIAPFGAVLAAHEGISWQGMERAAAEEEVKLGVRGEG